MFGRLNYSCYKVPLACLFALAYGTSGASAAGYGFDAGQDPNHYATNLAAANLTGVHGGWLRARGLAGSGGEGDHPGRPAAADRAGILALHQRGVKVCVILRWPPGEWLHGVRKGGGHRLALDLREPYERARKVAETYGDIADAWEIENEPDISFVLDNPETYAAFFKATSLGIKAGVETAKKRAAQMAEKDFAINGAATGRRSTWASNKRGQHDLDSTRFSSTSVDHADRANHTESGLGNGNDRGFQPRVVMAPLALPPGPYFESLWANDLASYTDAFNFHYYGYAQDFTGVYQQFENAVTTTPSPAPAPDAHGSSRRKNLPVFITEYGFGLLDADARNTAAGRVRQLRWFTSVAHQIHTLRPEAPMAFVLNPYLEGGINEFGLSMETRPRFSPEPLTTHGASTAKNISAPVALAAPPAATSATASPAVSATTKSTSLEVVSPSSLTFTGEDFQTKTVEPWTRYIGQKIGSAYASPALAKLWDYAARHPYQPRPWPVTANASSPVVIDFVAGADMLQVKATGGYSLQSASVQWSPTTLRTGRGHWILYNFSDAPVSGTMVFNTPELVTSAVVGQITLAAGERREIPVEFTIPAEEWTRRTLAARFIPSPASTPTSYFSTALVPATYAMVSTRVSDLRTVAASPSTISAQQARRVAVGEPRLQLDGRWLKTDGVRIIDDREGHWRFEVDRLPAEPLRPAMVELPLPADFEFKPDTALWFEYRHAPLAPQANISAGGETLQKPIAHHGLNTMDVYFRSATGNLFQTWPRLHVRPQWSTYNEDARHFSMAFFGRAALPWSFAENKPVALVFFLRPASLPTTFEVRGASTIRLQEL